MDREYISTERADLFDVNMMILMSIDVIGCVEDSQIMQAFHNAVNTHEIFGTKVVIDEKGNAYYEPCNRKNNTLRFCDQSMSEILNEQEKIRFRIEAGEFLRAFVRRNQKGFTITFLLHHLAGDGKSLCYFMESFMMSLADQELKYIPMKHIIVEELMPRSKMPFIYKLFVKYYNDKWKKEKKIFDFSDIDNSFKQFWEKHKTVVETRIIGESELLSMKNMCHDNHIGLTSFLIADHIKNTIGAQNIGLAVDGRLDGNRCMGNQATGISIKYKYRRNKDIICNAKKIDHAIKKKLTNVQYKYFIRHLMAAFDGTLIDAVNLEYSKSFTSTVSKKLATVLGYGEKTKDLSISNLTTIDIPTRYGEFSIDNVTFVPPVVSYGKNIIGIITSNDKMIISRHYYKV
ncbi:MAG: hypothetical protein UIC64_03335 [Agathobacter sp.]|nr:hypothetical protein [Agathobacter sp.]